MIKLEIIKHALKIIKKCNCIHINLLFTAFAKMLIFLLTCILVLADEFFVYLTYEKGGLGMAKVTFDESRCKGCMLCVPVCPKNIVKMATDRINEKGYHPATVVDMDKCIGCAFCAMMCPDVVIEVEK